jgi:hypothetical protein
MNQQLARGRLRVQAANNRRHLGCGDGGSFGKDRVRKERYEKGAMAREGRRLMTAMWTGGRIIVTLLLCRRGAMVERWCAKAGRPRSGQKLK